MKEQPQWAIKFLAWFCPDELLEVALGDFSEQFDQDVNRVGIKKARRRFAWNVFRYFHPYILFKNQLNFELMNVSIIKGYLKVAARNLVKYKFFSIVNILGLSFALAFVFMVLLFIEKEFSFDQFHHNKESIYRIYSKKINTETGEIERASAITSVPLVQEVKENIPGIVMNTRLGSTSATAIINGVPYKEKISFVDSDFLIMFDFPLIVGDEKSAFDQPNAVILTKEKAIKYFGEVNTIGKSFEYRIEDKIIEGIITGIVDAKQSASSIQFGILTPVKQYASIMPDFNSFNIGIVENYILIDTKKPISEIELALNKSLENRGGPNQSNGTKIEYAAQPLLSLHLDNEITGNAKYADPQKLFIMMALGLLVIVVGAINYISLSTGQSLNRIKEMGVRKTFGASKNQIKKQQIIEAFFFTLISGGLGLLIAVIILPLYNTLIMDSIQLEITYYNLQFIIILALIIALINGGIQSMILAKYKTILVLRGNNMLSKDSKGFGHGLLVIQFSLSIILIVGTFVIRDQMHFIQTKDLGYDDERLLEISIGNLPDGLSGTQLLERFSTASNTNSRIIDVSGSMNNSSEPWTNLRFPQSDGNQKWIFYNQVDRNYLKTMGIELKEGKDFMKEQGNNGSSILVNEALVKYFGWDQPLSMQIPGSNFSQAHQIIGVVKDFHYSSLHEEIKPLILAVNENAILDGVRGLNTYIWPPNLYLVMVRFGQGEIQPVITWLEKTWKDVNPNNPLVYQFVDQAVEAKYVEEERWEKIINYASIFAIGIAWLGLLALTRLSVQKRVKEIGIRKVLGSSVASILMILSRKYLVVVLIAYLIAMPLAFYITDQWLNTFTYRVTLNPMLFLIAGIGVLGLALLSVGLQSYKAANTNPVDVLKY